MRLSWGKERVSAMQGPLAHRFTTVLCANLVRIKHNGTALNVSRVKSERVKVKVAACNALHVLLASSQTRLVLWHAHRVPLEPQRTILARPRARSADREHFSKITVRLCALHVDLARSIWTRGRPPKMHA